MSCKLQKTNKNEIKNDIKYTGISLSLSTYKKLKILSALINKSASAVIEDALKEYFDNNYKQLQNLNIL
jgi:predicted transcriptional regulator